MGPRLRHFSTPSITRVDSQTQTIKVHFVASRTDENAREVKNVRVPGTSSPPPDYCLGASKVSTEVWIYWQNGGGQLFTEYYMRTNCVCICKISFGAVVIWGTFSVGMVILSNMVFQLIQCPNTDLVDFLTSQDLWCNLSCKQIWR